MAESTSGKGERTVGRVSSFSKLLRSPLRSNSSKSKRSKSALSKFNDKIFGSKKHSDKDSEINEKLDLDYAGPGEEDFEYMKDVSQSDRKEEANTKTSTEDEKKHDLLQAAQEGINVVGENLNNEIKEGMTKVNEGVGKVKEAFETTITKEELLVDQQLSQMNANVNKSLDEVKVSSIVEQLKEMVIDTPSTVEQVTRDIGGILDKIQPSSNHQNEGDSKDEEAKEENKKEDNCVSSLAQGLQKICAPWSIKKED